MIDYSLTQMYCLICDDDPDFLYVGHTTNWGLREKAHKYPDKRLRHIKVYRRIKELGGWNNIRMEHVEDYPCNTLREAEMREQYWIDTLGGNMNTNRAYITEEQRKERDNARREVNKEHISETKKAWRSKNKAHVNEQSRTWNSLNNERFKETNRLWREKNSEKIDCECGGRYTQSHRTDHDKSAKHKEWLKICGDCV